MGDVAAGLVVGLLVVLATVPWWWVRPARRVVPWARERRRAREVGRTVEDPVLLLELVDAALTTGAALPRVLTAVGAAVGGADGDALVRGAGALVLGASWPAAWADAPAGAEQVAAALRTAWEDGAAPGPALRARTERARQERRAAVQRVAAALGVHLVLPLGVCFLPAFVLLGVVPMVLSLAAGIWA